MIAAAQLFTAQRVSRCYIQPAGSLFARRFVLSSYGARGWRQSCQGSVQRGLRPEGRAALQLTGIGSL